MKKQIKDDFLRRTTIMTFIIFSLICFIYVVTYGIVNIILDKNIIAYYIGVSFMLSIVLSFMSVLFGFLNNDYRERNY